MQPECNRRQFFTLTNELRLLLTSASLKVADFAFEIPGQSFEKVHRGDANTARWIFGAKNFRNDTDPLPGGVGRPKFIQLEMVTTFTYKLSLVRIDARNFELSW